MPLVHVYSSIFDLASHIEAKISTRIITIIDRIFRCCTRNLKELLRNYLSVFIVPFSEWLPRCGDTQGQCAILNIIFTLCLDESTRKVLVKNITNDTSVAEKILTEFSPQNLRFLVNLINQSHGEQRSVFTISPLEIKMNEFEVKPSKKDTSSDGVLTVDFSILFGTITVTCSSELLSSLKILGYTSKSNQIIFEILPSQITSASLKDQLKTNGTKVFILNIDTNNFLDIGKTRCMIPDRIYEVTFEFLQSSNLVELENSILPKLFGPHARKSSLSKLAPTPLRRSHIAKMLSRSSEIHNETFGESSNNLKEMIRTNYSRISQARQKIINKLQKQQRREEIISSGSSGSNSQQNHIESNKIKKYPKISEAKHKLIKQGHENNLSEEIVQSENSELNSKQYQATCAENNKKLRNYKISEAEHKLIYRGQENNLPEEIVLSENSEPKSKQIETTCPENKNKMRNSHKIFQAKHKLIKQGHENNLSEEIVQGDNSELNSKQYQATCLENNKKLRNYKISEAEHKLIYRGQENNLPEEIVLSENSEPKSKQIETCPENKNKMNANKISQAKHKLIKQGQENNLFEEILLSGDSESNFNQNQSTSVQSNNINENLKTNNSEAQDKLINTFQAGNLSEEIVLSGISESNIKQDHRASVENNKMRNSQISETQHLLMNKLEENHLLNEKLNSKKMINNIQFSIPQNISEEDDLITSRINELNNYLNQIPHLSVINDSQETVLAVPIKKSSSLAPIIEINEDPILNSKENKKPFKINVNSSSKIIDTNNEPEIIIISDDYEEKQENEIKLTGNASKNLELKETNNNGNNSDSSQDETYLMSYLKENKFESQSENETNINVKNTDNQYKKLNNKNDNTIVENKTSNKKQEEKETSKKKNCWNKISSLNPENPLLEVIEADWDSENSESFNETNHPNIFTKKSIEITPMVVKKQETEKSSSGKRKLFSKNDEFLDDFESSPIIQKDQINHKEAAPCINLSLSKRDNSIDKVENIKAPSPDKLLQNNLTLSNKDTVDNNNVDNVEQEINKTPQKNIPKKYTRNLKSNANPEKRKISTENPTFSDNADENNSPVTLFESLKAKKKTKRPLKIRTIAKRKTKSIKITTEDIYDFQTSASETELKKNPSWSDRHRQRKIAKTKTTKHRNISEKLFDKLLGDSKSTPSSGLRCMLPAPKMRQRQQVNEMDDQIDHLYCEHNYSKINPPIENPSSSNSDSDNKFISLEKKNISRRKCETYVKQLSKNKNNEPERKKMKSNPSRDTSENEMSEKSDKEKLNKIDAKMKKKPEKIKTDIKKSKKKRSISEQNEQPSSSVSLNKNDNLLQASSEVHQDNRENNPLPQTTVSKKANEHIETNSSCERNDRYYETSIPNMSENDRFYETSISNISKKDRFYETSIPNVHESSNPVSKNDRFYETPIVNDSNHKISRKRKTSRFYETPILHPDDNKLIPKYFNGDSSRFYESNIGNLRIKTLEHANNEDFQEPTEVENRSQNEDDRSQDELDNNNSNNQDQSLEILNSKTPIMSSKKIQKRNSYEIFNNEKEYLELKKKQNYYEEFIREDHMNPIEIRHKDMQERYIKRFDKNEEPKEKEDSDKDSSGFTSRFSNINNSICLNGSNKIINNELERFKSTNRKDVSRFNSPNEEHLSDPSTSTEIRKRSLMKSPNEKDFIDYGGGGDFTGNFQNFENIPSTSKKTKYHRKGSNIKSREHKDGGDFEKNGDFESYTSSIDYIQDQLIKIFTDHMNEITDHNARISSNEQFQKALQHLLKLTNENNKIINSLKDSYLQFKMFFETQSKNLQRNMSFMEILKSFLEGLEKEENEYIEDINKHLMSNTKGIVNHAASQHKKAVFTKLQTFFNSYSNVNE